MVFFLNLSLLVLILFTYSLLALTCIHILEDRRHFVGLFLLYRPYSLLLNLPANVVVGNYDFSSLVALSRPYLCVTESMQRLRTATQAFIDFMHFFSSFFLRFALISPYHFSCSFTNGDLFPCSSDDRMLDPFPPNIFASLYSFFFTICTKWRVE